MSAAVKTAHASTCVAATATGAGGVAEFPEQKAPEHRGRGSGAAGRGSAVPPGKSSAGNPADAGATRDTTCEPHAAVADDGAKHPHARQTITARVRQRRASMESAC
jgi:hypothetical protein